MLVSCPTDVATSVQFHQHCGLEAHCQRWSARRSHNPFRVRLGELGFARVSPCWSAIGWSLFREQHVGNAGSSSKSPFCLKEFPFQSVRRWERARHDFSWIGSRRLATIRASIDRNCSWSCRSSVVLQTWNAGSCTSSVFCSIAANIALRLRKEQRSSLSGPSPHKFPGSKGIMCSLDADKHLKNTETNSYVYKHLHISHIHLLIKYVHIPIWRENRWARRTVTSHLVISNLWAAAVEVLVQ